MAPSVSPARANREPITGRPAISLPIAAMSANSWSAANEIHRVVGVLVEVVDRAILVGGIAVSAVGDGDCAADDGADDRRADEPAEDETWDVDVPLVAPLPCLPITKPGAPLALAGGRRRRGCAGR